MSLLIFNVSHLPAEIRAVFDIGTNKTKMQIAEVWDGSIKLLFSKTVSNPVLLEGNRIRKETIDRIIDVISSLKVEADPYRIESIRGIATEAFRKAENGAKVIEKLSVELRFPIKLISPEEEGRLAYDSAAYALKKDPAIVWDLGGGSSQIVGRKDQTWRIYSSPIGRVPFYNMLKEKILLLSRESILGWAETLFLEDKNLIKWIDDNACEVIGIGATFQFLREGESAFIYKDLHEQHEMWVRSEEALTELESDRILGLALMGAFGIKTVQYSFSPGNTVGVLRNEGYWEREK